MNGLKKEEGDFDKDIDNSKSIKKTNFIVTFAIFVIEKGLWAQYVRTRRNASEEELQKIYEEQEEEIKKYDRGTPFSHDKIALKDGKEAFIFYNQGIGYTNMMAGCIKAERYIFASLKDDVFNIQFLKESHKDGAHFKNWDIKVSEPKLEALPFCYDKSDELLSIPSLFSLGAYEGSEKFKEFGFDIDFSSFHNSINMFEDKMTKLYPSCKTHPEDRDYFHYAIEETFDVAIGPVGVTATKREKNIAIINNGELFEKGLLYRGAKRDISNEGDAGLNPQTFHARMEFIKTIAFISIEGGMWEKYACKHNILSDAKIKKCNEKLSKLLKDKFAKDRVAYTMLSHHNGDAEDKTFVIYNMPFEYIEGMAKKILQENFVLVVQYYSDSFDFSRYVEKDGIEEYLKCMDRKEKKAELNPSFLLEYQPEYIEGASITELNYKDDFNEGVCKKLKNFGLNLNLSAFEGVLSEFDDAIRELYPQVEKDGIAKRYLSKKIYDSIYKKGSKDRHIINSGRLFEPLE